MIDTAKLTPEWLAGFFDGEGCVCLHLSKNRVSLRINITQANEELLQAISEKYNANYVYAKPRGNNESLVYEVGWTGRNCIRVLEVLRGRVVVKHAQVELAFQFLETFVGQGYRLTDETINERESLRQRMRDLNHAGPFKPNSYITDSTGVVQ